MHIPTVSPYLHIHTLEELFENTLALDVHRDDTSPMDNIVYNFTGETSAYYVTLPGSIVDQLAECANDAMAVMYRALDHFMESNDPDKYKKLGIENRFLIDVIEDSYRIDETLRRVDRSLPNYCGGIYGNFDATIDEHGKVWFYEYNGNTPVMAYESIVIQDKAREKLGQSEDAQFNQLFEYWLGYFQSMFNDFGKLTIAMAGYSELVCDLLTIDVMSNAALQAGHDAIVVDIRVDIELDHLTNTLHLKGKPEIIDFLFTLYPWEEYDTDALIVFKKNYESLRTRGKGTIIAEPAYKVVLSNKAFLAYVYQHFATDAHEAGIIPTFMNRGDIIGNKYVEKPVYGRLSNNIKVYEGDTLISETEGAFADDLSVFQPFTPLIATGIAGNLQYRIWMAPGENYEFEACGFAIRKSNSTFSMETETEEFLPHVLTK